ncbi:MAG: cupin domain-containing protein [candidate division Zixibacteria bacterium]
MFYKKDSSNYKEPLDGVNLKTLSYGENMSLVEFHLKKGCAVPLHSHPHEQIGYLVSGKLRFECEGEEFLAEPGDSWQFPSNVEHMAEVLEDSVAVDIFMPVREEYMS